MSILFDHSFKLLTDDDPRAALAAFAGIPLHADVEIEPADRELNLSTLRVDNAWGVQILTANSLKECLS